MDFIKTLYNNFKPLGRNVNLLTLHLLNIDYLTRYLTKPHRFLTSICSSSKTHFPNLTLLDSTFVLYNAPIMQHPVRFANNNNDNDDPGIVGRSFAN